MNGLGAGEAPLEPPRAVGAAVAQAVSSVTLFRGRREIVILHRGQEYRLRITKADKLILTK